MKQTLTEIKAEAKAKELIEFFINIEKDTLFYWEAFYDRAYNEDEILPHAKKCSIKVADENIETLSNMKGMARIHKLTFWKMVKKNLTNEH